MDEKQGDGVNREGLDYRVGWVEALTKLARRLQLDSLRAKKNHLPGMKAAANVVKEMYQQMLAKMKGE